MDCVLQAMMRRSDEWALDYGETKDPEKLRDMARKIAREIILGHDRCLGQFTGRTLKIQRRPTADTFESGYKTAIADMIYACL